MENVALLETISDATEPHATMLGAEPSRSRPLARRCKALARFVAGQGEWVFGLGSLVLGLSILAAVPVAQLLTLGYLLEASARVAGSGRLRSGLIGVRKAARVGGGVAGIFASLIPLWLVGSYASAAELLNPGSPSARNWRIALGLLTWLTFLGLLCGCARGGKLRHFLWPFGHPFWLIRRLRRPGLYGDTRDGFWEFLCELRLQHYFRLGLIGFLGTLSWLAIPTTLLASGRRFPLLGLLGALGLAAIAPSLPFLQVRYALEGRASAFWSRRHVRDRYRRAPWAFAFSLMVLLVASVPLYLLKVELIPREAAWLPSLVFVTFLAPAHLLVGWAYSRSGRLDRPRHWLARIPGRLAIVISAVFYVLVVFLSQYTSWGGTASLFEQHAFLLPVPFLSFR